MSVVPRLSTLAVLIHIWSGLVAGASGVGENRQHVSPVSDLALLPPTVVASPWPQHIPPTSRQGVPGIERTARGRLWAVWVRDTESPRSYVALASSDDDGRSWSGIRWLIIPREGVRAMSSALWTDPVGRLWLFWGQSFGLQDGRYGVWAMVMDDPDAPDPHWSDPRRLGDGILMNKPTVLSNGDWLLPSSVWKADKSCRVLATSDRGATFQLRGTAHIADPEARGPDEPMIVERADGSLWMLVRTRGIAQTVSRDGGRTWTPVEPTGIAHPNSRFFIRRLRSGSLLLVKHGSMDEKTQRERLMAYVSDDDGLTWKGGLMIDERAGVTYPDGVEADNGTIYLIYDHNRTPDGEVLMATFREEDVRAGRPSSHAVRLRIPVHRLPASGLLPDPALQPPRLITSPGPEYHPSRRGAQGVPGLERTAEGRLWAAWYAAPGSRGVESPLSYVVLAASSDDGRTWSDLKLVVQPQRYVRTYDPCLWIDPNGRLWFFWAQSAGLQDGRMGVWAVMTEDPDSEDPHWSAPRRIAHGIMLNKPTVLSNGDWLLSVGLWRDNDGLPNLSLQGQDLSPYTPSMLVHDLGEERGSNVYRSRDQGRTFQWIGQARVPPTRVDEHMIVERRDGTLWMLVRTNFGIGQSVSTDGGRTWSPGTPYLQEEVIPNARFFIRRLQSGALLMVRHDGRKTRSRSHLTAFISDDEGASWQGGLVIDERDRVSYPDGVQAPDGTIYLIYDHERATLDRHGRAGVGAVLMAVFREEDVRAGRPVWPQARLGVVVNQLREGGAESSQ